MVDLTKSWVRFRDLPDEVLETMPEYVRTTFVAGRLGGFEVEMLCAGAKIPTERRASRRFVLVADDLGSSQGGGPLDFDLVSLAADVKASNRMFVISTTAQPDFYAAVYAAAVEDLTNGYHAALVVETRPMFAKAWARTLAALQESGAVSPSIAQPGATMSGSRRGSSQRQKRIC